MKFIVLTFYICCISLLSSSKTCAQYVVNVTGATITNTHGTISYAVGNTFYNDYSHDNGRITEGLFHIYQLPSSTDDTRVRSVNVSVFPNPATRYIDLSIDDSHVDSMEYSIYNASGSLVKRAPCRDEITRIELVGFAKGYYVIKVYDDTHMLSSYGLIVQ